MKKVLNILFLLKTNRWTKKISLLIFLLIILNCKDYSFNEPKENIQNTFKKFRNGDIKAYNQLKIYYLDFKPEEFIPIAKYAADTLNYTEANLDVFESYFDKYNYEYNSISNANISKMLPYDRFEAFKYLKKAIELNVIEANSYKILLDKYDNIKRY